MVDHAPFLLLRAARPLRLLAPAAAVMTILALLALGLTLVGLHFTPTATPAGPGCATTLNPGAVGPDNQPLPAGDTQLAALDTTQQANAAAIIATGQNMGVTPRGWMVAITTAAQESALRNLTYGDRDSLGLFQQRPSQGWGSPTQIMDPVYASTTFYTHLTQIPGWVCHERVWRFGCRELDS